MTWDQQFHVIAIVVSFYLLHVSITLLLLWWPSHLGGWVFLLSMMIFIIGVASWIQTWSS